MEKAGEVYLYDTIYTQRQLKVLYKGIEMKQNLEKKCKLHNQIKNRYIWTEKEENSLE